MAISLGQHRHPGLLIHLHANVLPKAFFAQWNRAADDHRNEAAGSGCPFLRQFSKHHSGASLRAIEQLRNTNAKDRYTKEKEGILVVGLSFHTAPMELREKLAVPETDWPRVTKELQSQIHIEEAAMLSTCNRTEVYALALSWHMGVVEVTSWMSKISGVPVEELWPHLYLFREDDAVRHLFRVTCGLDSLVLGEAQIQSQVKQVIKSGQGESGLGPVMQKLFQSARETGKLARERTDISSGAMSISAAAVELAALKLRPRELQWAKVLIIGAGRMSKLLVKHLISKGCSQTVVVNRTEKRVDDMRKEFGGEAFLDYKPLEQMHLCAGQADIVFTCTTSEQPLITIEDVRKLIPTPGGGTRYFIDISVPRNVEPSVGNLENVALYNVDNLKEVVAANQEKRRQEAAKAEAIIDEELHKFKAWRSSHPTIKKLRTFAERIRQEETEKLYQKLGKSIPDSAKKLIDNMTVSLMNKYLDGPQRCLRYNSSDPRIVENTYALERMFGLQNSELLSDFEERSWTIRRYQISIHLINHRSGLNL